MRGAREEAQPTYPTHHHANVSTLQSRSDQACRRARANQGQALRVAAKTRPALTGPARGGCEIWRSGRKNARGAGRTKEWRPKRIGKRPPLSSRPPALDHNTISSKTSDRQSSTPSLMITIPGTSDHHRLETVDHDRLERLITIPGMRTLFNRTYDALGKGQLSDENPVKLCRGILTNFRESRQKAQ